MTSYPTKILKKYCIILNEHGKIDITENILQNFNKSDDFSNKL